MVRLSQKEMFQILTAKAAPSVKMEVAKDILKEKLLEPKPDEAVRPKAAPGLLPNILSVAKFTTFGMGGGALITGAQMLMGQKPTQTDVAAGYAGASMFGLPAAAVAYTTLRERVEKKGAIGVPELPGLGLPSIAPSGQTPRLGEISFDVIAPPTIQGAAGGVIGDAGSALGLPDFGDIGKVALIAGVALAGVYLLGKTLGGRRG